MVYDFLVIERKQYDRNSERQMRFFLR